MKRIAFVIGSMHRGGAERVISILAEDYLKEGWNVDIIMLLFGDVDYQLSEGIRILDFSKGGGSRIKRLPYWLSSIRRYIKEYKPDVLLSFAARINIITMTAAAGLYANVIITERSDPRYDTRGKFARLLSKVYYTRAGKVIFQTEAEKSYYKGIRNGVIIPNPIHVTVSASAERKKRIVTAGRLEEEKNHRMLIRAFSDIAADFFDYVLEIYGSGSLRATLEKEIKECGIAGKVLIHDNALDIHEQIQDAELFVMSSDFEGLSNAMLEAMMMGLPVISTDVSGASDYIKNGENGLVVPVGDAKAMAEAMKKMLSDDEFRYNCGRNAKEVAKLVSKDVVLKQWHEVLDV